MSLLLCSGAKVGFCVLSNTCAGLGVTVIVKLELREEGLTLENVAEPLSFNDDFHMGWVYGMLLLDAVVYYVLAWYVKVDSDRRMLGSVINLKVVK